jgi:hypothetical protein
VQGLYVCPADVAARGDDDPLEECYSAAVELRFVIVFPLVGQGGRCV